MVSCAYHMLNFFSFIVPFANPLLSCLYTSHTELKQEVNNLKSLLNIEQSIHQAATGGNYRQVEVEAHMQELETEASSSSTTSELKELELLTEDYEKTLNAASKLKEEVEEYDIGSGIK